MIANSTDDPFYYLKNFQTVLNWVNERYGDLLDPHEQGFIQIFSTLPQTSRALLVRMIMRKGTLFRASKLRYAEIGATERAVVPLIESGWIDHRPQLTLEDLFGLLTKREITTTFEAYLPRSTMRKPELLEALQPLSGETRCFSDWCPDSGEDVYALPDMPMYDRFRLMFFGNLHQDWTEFVLADLGVYRYECVPFSSESRAFRDRSDVDTYLYLHRCRERFEEEEPLESLLADLPGPIPDNAWLESRRAKLMFRIAQACERESDLLRALDLYAHCMHPGARIRRLRVLEKIEEYETALALARDAERSPESAAEAQHLERLIPRLHRKLGLPKPAPSRSADVERLDLSLARPVLPLAVEHVVRDFLAEPGGPVHYVENTLINSLFGLLCWEAIFAPLPGAFFHPFHSGPVDLLHTDFYQRRAALFDACLAQLESTAYLDTVRDTFRIKQGIVSPFVHWNVLTEELLEQALACFPADHLKHWFTRLLSDIKANRAGMPDLIQFWPEQRCYRMVEVKGPGDRLQDNQRRWIEFCTEHGMPVVVCFVQWHDDG